MSNHHDMNIVIINKGQLEFALAKPRTNFYGVDMYPELYQKAAILMETITKAHALSDGNKRTAMMVAHTMVKINGGHLVLPLKSVQLSVNTAMDANDIMSDIIQQWFKVHITTDTYSLCSMLYELDEEMSIIKSLLERGREDDATGLIERWMAFDNYPDNRRAWDDLINLWKERQKVFDSLADRYNMAKVLPDLGMRINKMGLSHAYPDIPTDSSVHINDLHYNYNSLDELQDAEERINRDSALYRESEDTSLLLQNVLRLARYGMHEDAIEMFEKIRGMD